ncbi:Na(+)/citrate cotransporter-like [Rhopilema esculentum]|uniref:Na(+)/citrate cotransporter-like n=1 Tax=Rhopilema esculentum TaxID=499914 RepID=UPI0031CDDD22|eukprot:gene15342-6566_t
MAVSCSSVMGFLRRLKEWKRFMIIFLTPLILSPLPLVVQTKEARTGYAILIMGTYWCTEVTDLAVTALLPLFLFPVLSVMPAKEVAPPYFKDTNVLVLGGLIMAVAIERWNVHKRIALKVLLLVGAQPRRLMLGFMLVTAFISMWITNTATTAMMTPIMEAVLKQLDKEYMPKKDCECEEDEQTVTVGEENGANNSNTDEQKSQDNSEIVNSQTDDGQEMVELAAPIHPRNTSRRKLLKKDENDVTVSVDDDSEKPEDEQTRKYKLLCKAMMLSICYSANIGGTGTLTGTAPQLVLAGQLTDVFKSGPGISFLSWFIYAFPEMLIFLIVAWIYLQAIFFGISWKHLCCCFRWKKRNKSKGKEVYSLMEKQYAELGPVTFAEFVVLFHFLALVLCWMLRDPKFIPGWGSLFPMGKKSYVSDSTAAVIICFSMFVFPAERPEMFGGPRRKRPHKTILEWKATQLKFPWNVTLLLGSGFALARACEKSGLSMWLGCQLTALNSVPNFVIALVISILLTFLTEFTSNTATATILLPVLASLAQSIRVHPFYLMVPATICSSFAFMLPVATPPNAIVFATGRLTIPDMMKAGFGMNLIGILVVTLSINTFGMAYFGLDKFPAWAEGAANGKRCGLSIPTTLATNLTTLAVNASTTLSSMTSAAPTVASAASTSIATTAGALLTTIAKNLTTAATNATR